MNRYRMMWPLAGAFIAALAFETAVHAYSDQAITDAEAAVEQARKRFDFGEIDSGDMAIVLYNSLEMKLRAGTITHSSFCTAAKSHLQAMAETKKFDEEDDDDTNSQRVQIDPAQLKQQIEKMTETSAMCRLVTETADAILFRERDYHGSFVDALKDAATRLEQTRDRYKVGEVTRSDVAGAQAELLELQYNANELSLAAYCASPMLATLNQLLQGVESEAAVGQRTIGEVLATRRRLYRFKTVCDPG
jgi:hypothetical protein